MVVGSLGDAAADYALVYGGGIGEVLVKGDDKVVAEALGHTAVVAGGIAHYLALLGQYLHVRAVVVGVDHHEGRVCLRECEAEAGGTLGGCNLCHHVVVGEIGTIVVGRSLLGLVGEPAGALLFVKDGASGDGHQREHTVVIDPRAGLMGLLETTDFGGGVGVGPSVAVLAGLRYPEVHAPRHGYRGIGVAGRYLVGRCRAYQRAYIIYGFGLAPGVDHHGHTCRQQYCAKGS